MRSSDAAGWAEEVGHAEHAEDGEHDHGDDEGRDDEAEDRARAASELAAVRVVGAVAGLPPPHLFLRPVLGCLARSGGVRHRSGSRGVDVEPADNHDRHDHEDHDQRDGADDASRTVTDLLSQRSIQSPDALASVCLDASLLVRMGPTMPPILPSNCVPSPYSERANGGRLRGPSRVLRCRLPRGV